MAAALTDQQLKAIEQQMSADPTILQQLQLYQRWAAPRGRLAYTTKGGPPNPQQVLASHGINFPDISDYQIQVDPNGAVHLDRQNWLARNADWILPVATIGTGGAVGLAGGGGAAGGSSALSEAVPGAEGGAAAGATGAGVAGGTAAATTGGTAASTGFGAALKAALPTIIGAGANVAGSAIASHGNTEAAKTQAAATEKAAQIQADQLDRALAQAKYIYQTQRADLSGYRSGGNNALGALSFGLGLPAPSFDAPPVDPSIANPPPTTSVAPGAVDANGKPLPGAGQNQTIPPPPTDAQQRSGSASVKVQDPSTGLVHLIPSSQVAAAQQAGGVLV